MLMLPLFCIRHRRTAAEMVVGKRGRRIACVAASACGPGRHRV